MLVTTVSVDLPPVDCCARGGMRAFFGYAFKVYQGGWTRFEIADAFLFIMYARVWLALWDVEALPFEMHSKAWILGLDPGSVLVHVSPGSCSVFKLINFLHFKFK